MFETTRMILGCLTTNSPLIVVDENGEESVAELQCINDDVVSVRLPGKYTIAAHISKIRIPQGVIDSHEKQIKIAYSRATMQKLIDLIPKRNNARENAITNIKNSVKA